MRLGGLLSIISFAVEANMGGSASLSWKGSSPAYTADSASLIDVLEMTEIMEAASRGL